MPGKKFPDLTGDGKVTQADVLKGRGVKMMRGGKVPGMMRGGKVKMRYGGKLETQDGGMADVVKGMAMVKDVAQQMNKPRAQVDGMNANQISSAMGVQDVPMTSGGLRKIHRRS